MVKTETGNCCFNLDRTSNRTVVMATAQQVSFCFFVINISGAKFENTASIFPKILFIQNFMIVVANLMTLTTIISNLKI